MARQVTRISIVLLMQLFFLLITVVFGNALIASPSNAFVQYVSLIGVTGFFFSVGFSFRRLLDTSEKAGRRMGIIISVSIFTLAFMLGMSAGEPDMLSAGSAEFMTKKQIGEVRIGSRIADSIKYENDKPEDQKDQENDVKEQLEGKAETKGVRRHKRRGFYDPSQIEKVKEEALNSDKSETELIDQFVKLIPISPDSWACGRYGCSYTDCCYVWTISWTNLIGSIFIETASLGLILWTVNDYKLKTPARFKRRSKRKKK